MYRITVLLKEEKELKESAIYTQTKEEAKEMVNLVKKIIKQKIKRIEIEGGIFEAEESIYLECY